MKYRFLPKGERILSWQKNCDAVCLNVGYVRKRSATDGFEISTVWLTENRKTFPKVRLYRKRLVRLRWEPFAKFPEACQCPTEVNSDDRRQDSRRARIHRSLYRIWRNVMPHLEWNGSTRREKCWRQVQDLHGRAWHSNTRSEIPRLIPYHHMRQQKLHQCTLGQKRSWRKHSRFPGTPQPTSSKSNRTKPSAHPNDRTVKPAAKESRGINLDARQFDYKYAIRHQPS